MITKRENETVTQFAMRQIRNEILEKAAKTLTEEYSPCHQYPISVLVARIRDMKDEN